MAILDIQWQSLVMIPLSLALLYLAIARRWEPLLLIPAAFGMLIANLADVSSLHALSTVNCQLSTAILLLCIGAMTDFGPLLANPASLLLGGAAQLGIPVVFALAKLTGLFSAHGAAAAAFAGGANGPLAILNAAQLPEQECPFLPAIVLPAYIYMALAPIIQPPVMRLLTTQNERAKRQKAARAIGKRERILFPIIALAVIAFLLPSTALPLGMFLLGNLLRACGLMDRLGDAAQRGVTGVVTILLGLGIGLEANGAAMLRPTTLIIFALGLAALVISTAGGVLCGKLLCLITRGRVNPLIGAAGAAMGTMSAKTVQKEGVKARPGSFLQMDAMGANAAGLLASIVVAGILWGA